MAQTQNYLITSTDSSTTFTIPPKTFSGPTGVQKNTDLTLYGNASIGWGESFNSNFFRLLENFSCQEKPTSPGIPLDFSDLGGGLGINNPVTGQLWFNKTDGKMYIYRTTGWTTLTTGTAIGDIEGLEFALSNVVANDGSGTITGTLDMNNNNITNVKDPVTGTDAMSRDFTDGRYIQSDGSTTGLPVIEFAGGITIPPSGKIYLSSDQTDAGAIYKFEPATDASHTRIQLSDNFNSTLDMLSIGTDGVSGWNTTTLIDAAGNIITAGDIDGKNIVGSSLTLTSGTKGISANTISVHTVTGIIDPNAVINQNSEQLMLNAGETGGVIQEQSGEIVAVNAEGGLVINSSPDNWTTGWAGRITTKIDSTGITTSDIEASGTSTLGEVLLKSSNITGAKLYTDVNNNFNISPYSGATELTINQFGYNAATSSWYFDSPLYVPTPTNDFHAANKGYVDSLTTGTIVFGTNLFFPGTFGRVSAVSTAGDGNYQQFTGLLDYVTPIIIPIPGVGDVALYDSIPANADMALIRTVIVVDAPNTTIRQCVVNVHFDANDITNSNTIAGTAGPSNSTDPNTPVYGITETWMPVINQLITTRQLLNSGDVQIEVFVVAYHTP